MLKNKRLTAQREREIHFLQESNEKQNKERKNTLVLKVED